MVLVADQTVDGLVALTDDALHLVLQAQDHLLALALYLCDHFVVGGVEFLALLPEDLLGDVLDDPPVGDGVLVDGDVEGGDVLLELSVEVAGVFGEGV